MIVSTNNEQLLPVSEQLKCFLAIKTALRNVTNGILPVCLEKKLLPKVLDLLELEMQHLSHRKKTVSHISHDICISMLIYFNRKSYWKHNVKFCIY